MEIVETMVRDAREEAVAALQVAVTELPELPEMEVLNNVNA